MKEEDPIQSLPKNNPEQQENEPYKTVELTEAKEVQSYFDFADPMLDVDWGPDGVPLEYEAEYITAHPEETMVFGVYEGETLVGGGKVTMLTDEQMVRIEQDPEIIGKKAALLEYVAVQMAHRRKHILLTLTQQRLEWAKNNGAQYVYSEITLDNPISAISKFKMGFRIYSIQPAGAGIPSPYLVLRKDMSETHTDTEHEIKPERTEIPVTDDTESAYQKIGDLLHEGWIGVDIKVNEENPIPWTLILEREVTE